MASPMTLRPKAAIRDDLALLSLPFLSGSNRRICSYRVLTLDFILDRCLPYFWVTGVAFAIVAASAGGSLLLR